MHLRHKDNSIGEPTYQAYQDGKWQFAQAQPYPSDKKQSKKIDDFARSLPYDEFIPEIAKFRPEDREGHLVLKTAWLYLTPQTLVFLLFSAGYSILMAMAFKGESIANECLTTLIFLVFGVSMIVLGRVSFHWNQDDLGGWKKTIPLCLVAIIVDLGVNEIIGMIEHFSVINFFYWMFYINTAIAEEMMYRVFIVSLVAGILELFKWFNDRKIVVGLMAAVSSGVCFLIAHGNVYGNDPLMLLEVFIAGFALACVYYYGKDPFPIIVAHVLLNVIVAAPLLLL